MKGFSEADFKEIPLAACFALRGQLLVDLLAFAWATATGDYTAPTPHEPHGDRVQGGVLTQPSDRAVLRGRKGFGFSTVVASPNTTSLL